MVERKKIEVENLLRRHQEVDDPLVMRMSYVASECRYNVTNSLRKDIAKNKENLHTISVTIDMKRRSPTIPERRNIVEFQSAGRFMELLTIAKADAFFVNTDEVEYGGKYSELLECSKQLKKMKFAKTPPALILKDIIIHPVQIAQALENGASGVLLIVAVVGADLEVLLNACTVMGTEAVVEVHTPNELDYALSRGATIFLVNMWDRMTGLLHKNQAKGLIRMMPMNSVAVAAGDIRTASEAAELGFYGYDSVVLGRNIVDVPDIKGFIDDVHSFRGVSREMMAGLGTKGIPWD